MNIHTLFLEDEIYLLLSMTIYLFELYYNSYSFLIQIKKNSEIDEIVYSCKAEELLQQLSMSNRNTPNLEDT